MTTGNAVVIESHQASPADDGTRNESLPMLHRRGVDEEVTTTAGSPQANDKPTTASNSPPATKSATLHETSNLLGRTMKSPTTSCLSSLLADRSLRVDFLAILFGIGSWIGVNSVYLQLPLFVTYAPEGWSLPSYLVIVIQIANIGPLAYTLFQKYSPRKLNDSHVIYVLFLVGFAASICMITLYKEVVFVAGENRSVALFATTFAFALVGCTSSVLFMPYMGRFKEIYLITYLVGEGLSGFLPSLLTLVQGVGGNTVCVPDQENPGEQMQFTPDPLFGSNVFFGFIMSLVTCSGLAFVLLNKMRYCHDEYATVRIGYGNDYQYEEDLKLGDSVQSTNVRVKDDPKKLSPSNYILLMFMMAVVSMFGSGIFPSLQSYSCLPYGNLSYHLTVTLSSIANPIACFMAVFLPHKSIKHINILGLVTGLITAYALATAVLSPNPPLQGTAIGQALVIISWTILTGLVSYIKLSITSIFRYQGGQSLVWIGAVSQTGSACGAVISFCLVNFTSIFVSYQPC